MSNKELDIKLLDQLKGNKKIFVPYIMAGDGPLDGLEERLTFLQQCGVTAIELGIPFSDPVADGLTIQQAGIRALANGTTLKKVMDTLTSFAHRREIPIILMTYVNPILQYGTRQFATDCRKANVNGVIIPDLPMEEEQVLAVQLQEFGISFIRLAALTSPIARLQKIAGDTEGFLYAVAVTGTTGTNNNEPTDNRSYLETLKSLSPAPVLAGFGVDSIEKAHTYFQACDGVIVGSKLVELFHGGKYGEIESFIKGCLDY